MGTVSQKNTFWHHPTATRFGAVDDTIPNGAIVGDDEISVWKGRRIDTIQDVGQQIPAFLAFSLSCRVDGIKNRQKYRMKPKNFRRTCIGIVLLCLLVAIFLLSVDVSDYKGIRLWMAITA